MKVSFEIDCFNCGESVSCSADIIHMGHFQGREHEIPPEQLELMIEGLKSAASSSVYCAKCKEDLNMSDDENRSFEYIAQGNGERLA